MGWRVPSELLTRERKHIVGDMLVLERDEAKSDEPRQVPLNVIPELRDTIKQQFEATRKLEVEQSRVINLLFHNNGKPIVDYRPAWHKACEAAGLGGRIPHDFRRTAARNPIAAGVDPMTTCARVGRKGLSMLQRYKIIETNTLKRGVAKLRTYLKSAEEETAEGEGSIKDVSK